MTSTNTWLFEHLECLDIDGLIVQTTGQTEGKGRNQRVWAKTFILFIGYSPTLYNRKYCGNHTTCRSSINKALRKLTHLPFEIKWPNDILIGNHKTCGIWCETKYQNENQPAIVVIGFGINVNGNSSQYPSGTSKKVTIMQMVTSSQYDINMIRELVLNEFERIYHTSIDSGLKPIIKEWEQLSCSIGRKIFFERGGNKIIDEIVSILLGEIEFIESIYDKDDYTLELICNY